ncbi:MAG TPA: UDP-N-acetylglucosamine 1-carboxyvinyltransferase [Syntrophomonadaceae bacterium]|nr:UDP-N-acetylglucosamine 1-carboxyvinyltransferase [Syntrophomonadaceae bacterium]
MQYLIIEGNKPLKGDVQISGSKNATLPIMAASLIANGEVILNGVPDLEDIHVMSEALKHFGAKIHRENDVLIIDSRMVNSCELPEAISRKMRASNLMMGALLARFKEAKVAYPGGCAIGTRPMDLHLKGFESLGYNITDGYGYMEGRGHLLSGNEILLDFPSVGATENIMMAASVIRGNTVIRNAAREPEIVDLQNFLNSMGAKIKGAGLDTIRIEGVQKLSGVEHRIIPDRIEAGSFMVAAAISRGEIFISNVIMEHIQPVVAKLREIGLEIIPSRSGLKVLGNKRLRTTDIKTMPYPGFPTDMQAQMMALLSTIPGTSIIVETIFENRFMHVQELRRMAAEIRVEGRVAIIKGKKNLEGTSVEATDLRAGAALVLAALAAEGETKISKIEHIDRGYEKLHVKLRNLGANITRTTDLS